MKHSKLIVVALILAAAPLALASVSIQKKAKAKDPKVTCTTCHESKPCTKANLTAEGKKWVPAKK